ncbi:Peptidase S8 and S53 subtilisin kexin sedolisin [Candidatus Nitrosacidococcus tergens]|uniref:Peptidase S8 and S53 subtilisin kexin sedolisin n=2 Tax=Candidatus Nitrosacidococcus tergens TaxID=553981 RepID=A0A7G1QAJ7_9GAMM|nr:Peptidase S8 and S53 subtilisin kexin sedolisin [Candidatus Nitrosacidococcus tergens]
MWLGLLISVVLSLNSLVVHADLKSGQGIQLPLDSKITTMMQHLLTKDGKIENLSIPESSAITKQSVNSQSEKSNPPQLNSNLSPSAIVDGLVVRFKDQKIQDLAAENLPPPDEIMNELESTLGEKLTFYRSMGNQSHIFRFQAPKSGEVVTDLIQKVKTLSSIDQIEPDIRIKMQLVPNDPLFDPYQWSMKGQAQGYIGGINATGAWDSTQGSASTIVAVVDTGVNAHPEFADRLLPGYDFFVTPYAPGGSDPGDWTTANECGDKEPAEPSSWHGTHVTGIIAAEGNNDMGMAGVNWNTKILPVRTLGKCGGSLSDVINGILWAAGLSVPNVPINPNPAQVINLSLAGEGACPPLYQETISLVLGQGAQIVVAAGNDQKDISQAFPGNCNGVLTTIATNFFGDAASYTNLNLANPNIGGIIAAPGGDSNGIISTTSTGTTTPEGFGYNQQIGTSESVPHVVGIASLMLGINPALSGIELNSLLPVTSQAFPEGSLCAKYQNLCGLGIADAQNAIEAATTFKNYTLIYEFYNSSSNDYLLATSKAQMAAINRGEAGSNWQLTGNLFYAWSGATNGAQPVCQFYNQGANSYFYTVNSGDCNYLQSLNPTNAVADDQWTYEGIAFYALSPTNGACASNSDPIYQLYNNQAATNNPNHRFVTSLEAYNSMIAQGWLGEGITMCVAAVA